MDKIIKKKDGTLLFLCPGCNKIHVINQPERVLWEFNEKLDKPTIRPSILNKSQYKRKGKIVKSICHSFITDGKIRFLNDCTHEMAGETVELIDVIEDNYNFDVLKYY